jgi:Family of unknown function (DUF6010)
MAHIIPELPLANAIAAVGIAIVYISVFSLVKEPSRQKINAVIIAGAGAVYWSGGLGIWEYVFATAMLFMAFKGLSNYKYIGIAWLMHTTWDTLHHLYANPIVPFSASSSAGCAVCDSILALWFFYKAPSIFTLFNKKVAV